MKIVSNLIVSSVEKITTSFTCVLSTLKRICRRGLYFLNIFSTYFKDHRLFTSILIFTFLLFILGAFAITFPVKQPFEGELVVSQMGLKFLKNQKSFLEDFRVNKVVIRGEGKYELGQGVFISPQQSELQNLNRITLNLQSIDSSLEISVKEKNFPLDIEKLDLSQGSVVKGLRYSPDTSLYFGLEQVGKSSKIQVNFSDRVKISCIGECQIKELNRSLPKVDFDFEAQNPSYAFSLLKTSSIDFEMANLEDRPFKGSYSVDWAILAKRRGFYDQSSYESSIISGVVRMLGNAIRVNQGQFLLLGKQKKSSPVEHYLTDIKQINYIEVVNKKGDQLIISADELEISESYSGLKVGLSGKTDQVKIGINSLLPVELLSTSFLSQFSPDLQNAIILIFTSASSILLTWIFGNIPKKS